MAPPVVLAAAKAVAAARRARRHRATARLVAAGLAALALVAGAVVVAVVGAAGAPARLARDTGVEPEALEAYRRAAGSPAGRACGMRWQVLAAVARSGPGPAPGDSRPMGDPEAGPTTVVAAATSASDTADPSGPQALGDPDTAVALLCGAGPMTDAAALRSALVRYGRGEAYAQEVLGWVAYFDRATVEGAGEAGPPELADVRGIRVARSLAPALEALMAAAEADGLVLGGSGYRSIAQQVALRRAHCGTSPYAVYQMPASACVPPTARPGQSQHQAGLAVDFTCDGRLVSAGDRCHRWLAERAGGFGLHNLPSEPWHWSTNGR